MESIRCTAVGCLCCGFSPLKTHLRICSSCRHGWVIHAMDKVGKRPPGGHVTLTSSAVTNGSLEANYLFDVTSLILFGSDAVPTRLKILLDRLFAHFDREILLQILAAFEWTYEDYSKGYKIRDGASGRPLDKWTMATTDEEFVIFEQFLKFSETKEIAEELISTDHRLTNCSAQTRLRFQTSPSSSTSSSSSSVGDLGQSPTTDLKQFLLGDSSGDVSRQLFGGQTFYPLSSFLHRYPPNIYSSLLPATVAPAGSVAVRSVLPYLMCGPSVVRNLAKPGESPLNPVSLDQRREDGGGAARMQHGNGGGGGGGGGGKEGQEGKVESTEESRNSVSSRDTLYHSTDDDEPIDYSTKDGDRVVPDVVMATVVQPNDSSSVTGSPDARNAVTSANDPSDVIDRQQHQRKSSGGVKKVYHPTPGYGGTLVSPNGKKRVLCTACLKTFCDKGALKIHYSAVHLKELHMCTIDGCSMMFSSRRSRNRHSANPNPKLHFGLTGRRRLHNNNNSSSSCHSGAIIRPSHSPNDRHIDECTYEKFHLYLRSDESEERSESESPNEELSDPNQFSPTQQIPRSLNEDASAAAAFFLGLGLNRPKKQRGPGNSNKETDSTETTNSPVVSNLSQRQLKTYENDEKEAEIAAAAAAQRSGSKRKSTMPTKCFAPFPTDEREQMLRTDSSEKRKIPKITSDEQRESADGGSIVERDDDVMTNLDSENVITAVKGMQREASEENRISVAASESISSCLSVSDKYSEALVLSKSVPNENRSCVLPSVISNETDVSTQDVATLTTQRGEGFKLDNSMSLKKELKRATVGLFPVTRHPVEVGRSFFQLQRSFHLCRVDGCNAKFPSKRSRDRHSANSNLHRRLLLLHHSNSVENDVMRRKRYEDKMEKKSSALHRNEAALLNPKTTDEEQCNKQAEKKKENEVGVEEDIDWKSGKGSSAGERDDDDEDSCKSVKEEIQVERDFLSGQKFPDSMRMLNFSLSSAAVQMTKASSGTRLCAANT